MNALVAAAKKEGTLNVIALPPDWANYGNIIKAFTRQVRHQGQLGATRTAAARTRSTRSSRRTAPRPRPTCSTSAWRSPWPTRACSRPYQVSTWSDIPASQKEPTGLWYQDYGGYMSIGYDSAKFGTITSVSQLLGPKFKSAVALNGNPTAGQRRAERRHDGEPGRAAARPTDIAKGVDFFHQLKAGRQLRPRAGDRRHDQGGHDPGRLQLGLPEHRQRRGPGRRTGRCSCPPNAVLGGYYAQAINKNAPHPAAARLWEEFLYSQAADGGQNLWLRGRRPAGRAGGDDQQRHHRHGRGRQAAAGHGHAGVPEPRPRPPTPPTYLAANWAKAVS